MSTTTLSTERLELRQFVEEDASFIIRLLNQPAFIRFIGDKGVRTLEDAEKYLVNGPMESYRRHGFGLYLVALKETNEPIGMCGLLKRETLPDVDLGFAFLAEHRRKGYAFEAALAIVDQAKEVFKLNRILAITNPDNDASIKLLERLGFRFERVTRLSKESDEVKVFGLRVT